MPLVLTCLHCKLKDVWTLKSPDNCIYKDILWWMFSLLVNVPPITRVLSMDFALKLAAFTRHFVILPQICSWNCWWEEPIQGSMWMWLKKICARYFLKMTCIKHQCHKKKSVPLDKQNVCGGIIRTMWGNVPVFENESGDGPRKGHAVV